ncbi:sensor histidine kinase [Sphingobacterium psychroaquaticum]|uniref:histidine kinase n=1 Tax=Sphingobacterium psychroaquaticum TaxID=561061 RepID=A0A1X7K7K6_9SPHI|nr:HAMP domain-containing sensor histidine kinase [Sphingobacterium psychroaquaticum]SMG36379.1 Signal transduction histidine kinase [Sphingobacterium psychroaquaticum]
MKIKLKIFLLFFFITFLLLGGFAVYVSYFTRDSLRTKFFHRLEENARIVGKHTLENDEYLSQLYYEVRRDYLRQLSEGNDYILRIEKNATDIKDKPNLALPEDFYARTLAKGTAEYMNKDTAYLAVFFVDSLHSKDLMVISSGRDDYGLAEQDFLDRALISGGIIAILVVALVAFVFSNSIIRPISLLDKEIKKISIASLSLRLRKRNEAKDEISSLIDSFNDMIGRLEIAVKSQRSFLGNASHSFRTPLTIIKGEAQLALKDCNANDEAYQPLTKILEEVDRMILIVNNLLTLAKTGMNENKRIQEVIRIDELLFRVINSERSVEPDKNIELDFDDIPEDSASLEVFGNPNLLYIALSNIVSNAFKYGNDRMVSIKLMVREGHVVVQISDQGIGIPSGEQEFIYDSFYRASNVGSTYGNGLGLLLAKNIIDVHQGEMYITSEEGFGTTVTVKLPTHGQTF